MSSQLMDRKHVEIVDKTVNIMSSQPPAGSLIKKTNLDEVTSIVRALHAKKFRLKPGKRP